MTVHVAAASDLGNGTSWEELGEVGFVVANSLILLMTSAVGSAANIFVVLAVYHQKSLQTSNNALVVNLAVVDLLRCMFDCPILLKIVMSVYTVGRVQEQVCDTQTASFSFSCCIQLLTLACISAERHQAIAQPSKAGQQKTRIMVLIPLIWILALVVAIFCVIYLRDSPVHVRCVGGRREHLPSYDTFGFYMLFPLWAACFTFIISFYTRIFLLVKSHNRKIFDKGTVRSAKADGADDRPPKSEKNVNLRAEAVPTLTDENARLKKSSTSLQSSAKAVQCVSDNLGGKSESKDAVQIYDLESVGGQEPQQVGGDPPKAEKRAQDGTDAGGPESSGTKTQMEEEKATGTLKTEMETKEPDLGVPQSEQLHVSKPETEPDPKQTASEGAETPACVVVCVEPPVSCQPTTTEVAKESPETDGAVCMMPSKASKERARKKKESKMAKRAGYIIVTFLLFWTPLVTTILANLVSHMSRKSQILMLQDVEILSVSVACVTSLSDPIIYAVVNPQFRTEFHRLKNKAKAVFKHKV